jgi:hypothetical protein
MDAVSVDKDILLGISEEDTFDLALFASQILVELGTNVKGDEVSFCLVNENLLDNFILF